MSERFLFDDYGRKIFGFFFYGFALIMLLYDWKSGVLISQMARPTLVYPSSDIPYWLFILSGIPRFLITHQLAANIFDVMLVGSAAMAAINCNKREYSLVFTIFIWIYFFLFNTFSGHHYHALIGIMLLSIPFLMGKPKTFSIWMEMVRYYYLFIFSSAALWKLFRGAVFHSGHLKAILMEQHVGYLAYHHDSFQAKIIIYLIRHSSISDVMFIALCSLQLIFLIGFFTSKFDKWLFWIAVFFHLSNWMVMRVFSAELVIMNITLLNWPALFPVLSRFFPSRKLWKLKKPKLNDSTPGGLLFRENCSPNRPDE